MLKRFLFRIFRKQILKGPTRTRRAETAKATLTSLQPQRRKFTTKSKTVKFTEKIRTETKTVLSTTKQSLSSTTSPARPSKGPRATSGDPTGKLRRSSTAKPSERPETLAAAAAVVTITEEVTEVGVTREATTADAAVEEEMATTIAAAMEAEVNKTYFISKNK